ncbi:MAG: site-specific DNA-methyltransferase [Rhodobacteraceae bacterium]|nr:site-specific DNA-methyltransferase [Paracoccaceae bacterium]
MDLIATDPPFNKGRDFHATPDSLAAGARFQDRWSWERDVHESWTDQITDDYPRLMEAIESARYAHSDGMGAYMCFMAVRLLAMHRVLKPTGSIYLHCDPTASHYLKAVMDAIFGWKNFRNEIVWCYEIGGRGKKRFAAKHDIILYYAKSKNADFNANDIRLPRRKTHMKVKIDEQGQEWQIKRDAKTGKVYRYPVSAGALCPDWWSDIQQLNRSDPQRAGWPLKNPSLFTSVSSKPVLIPVILSLIRFVVVQQHSLPLINWIANGSVWTYGKRRMRLLLTKCGKLLALCLVTSTTPKNSQIGPTTATPQHPFSVSNRRSENQKVRAGHERKCTPTCLTNTGRAVWDVRDCLTMRGILS